ncbi:hypothetical protein BS17DRAFT_771549 [Gyrodon lividus]|nr:hypothetical protein BS17DRAFT_771549 [Gyrodon lividus]
MSLKLPMPTTADLNRMTYEGAAKLREEMSQPGGQPEKLNFGVMPICSNCDAPIMAQKPLVCSGCKSAIYCSKKCHVANWKIGRYGTESHKLLCERNKRHMQKIPQVQAILKLFPWGRLESDGTFAEPFIRAYYGVLGAEGFGYWSTSGGTAPHQLQPSTRATDAGDAFRVGPVGGYQDGYLLLSDRHIDEKAGWKLEKRLVPKLCFEPSSEPVIASSVNLRGLPLESPAALLMHYPLTVYQLLVHVLNITSPTRNSPEHRQILNVHYLGAESELNMLPLFSELALLLPYTDIKLTFFGFAVHGIVQQAKKKSIAAKAKRNEPVYTYTSPASMGGSTLLIYLHGEHENWDPRFASITDDTPDAIVALNAGLLAYKAWAYVILYCHIENMPFGVTEYAEQSAELQRDSFSEMINNAIPSLGPRLSTAELENLVKPRQYPIVFNQFQRPGQRNISTTRLPSVSNGFTIKVIGKDSEEGKKEVTENHNSASMPLVVSSEVRQLFDKAKDMLLNDLD